MSGHGSLPHFFLMFCVLFLEGLPNFRSEAGTEHLVEHRAMRHLLQFSLLFLGFSFGFFLGYREGMATMKRIDDNIIEEAKRCIYGEE